MLYSPGKNRPARWEWLCHLGGLSLAMATSVPIFLLLLQPLQHRHAELQKQEIRLRHVLDLESQLRDDNRRLRQALSAADHKTDSLLDRIPNLPREADFLGQVTQLSRDVGLKIADYRPNGVQENDEYQEMIVTLSSEGSYASVCSFLQGIHHLPRLSTVRELKILPRQDGKKYSMEMTLAIYFAPKNKLAVGG